MTPAEAKRCQQCKVPIYCGAECQKKDWKTHKLVCIDSNLTKPYTVENQKIRAGFSNGNEHVAKTQELILKGAAHLNPEKSVVVVCGAQYYNGGFVEPLPQLLEKCKKLVLVDVDPTTLNELHTLLGNSPKVSKVALDLSASLKNIPNFRKETAEITNPDLYIDKIIEFLNNATLERAAGLPGVLEEGETADYVISSLVSSQLAIRLKELLFSLYAEKFKSPIQFKLMTPAITNKLLPVFAKLSTQLPAKHAEDLAVWAGEKGRIYLSDTFTCSGNILLPKRVDELFAAAVKPGERLNWNYRVSFFEDYKVQAYIR